MTDSKGSGDPVVTIGGGKDQVSYSRGGVPYTTRAANVSPEIQYSNTQDGDSAERTDAIDIIVYFPDKTGVQVKVRDGQNIEAGELFELVMGVMEFPAEARESFSLWLVSDLLELQLKPTHVPFKLVCYWEELLEKYTTAPDEHLQRDEPVIMFKRNVFNSRDAEKNTFFSSTAEQNEKLTGLLRYLYWEAKRNVLDGRYPFISQDCDTLAGIQAVITPKEMRMDEQEVDAGFGAAHYFKSHLTDYLPQHFCKRHWIRTRDNPENRIASAYAGQSDNAQHSDPSLHKLYQTYLEKCHALPYYGSAFFRGQAEHPVRGIVSKVLSTKDDPVYVAINVEGVFIIDMDDFALLIGFYYENLSWQFVESDLGATNPNCLPCLFLQFPDEEDRRNTKLLQIFSREAILMDNLIEACVQLKKTLGSTKSPDESRIVYGKGDIAETFKHLAFMKFSPEGKELGRTIRRPKQAAATASAANV